MVTGTAHRTTMDPPVSMGDGVALLRPEEPVFEAMLDGWRNQQLARNLALSTIDQLEKRLRAFAAHVQAFPWQWLPQMADKWFGDLRAGLHTVMAGSTGRQAQRGRGANISANVAHPGLPRRERQQSLSA